MRNLLCLIFPPLAVLLTGRPISALVNFFLCLLFVVPGVIHAIIVVSEAEKERRHREMLSAVSGTALPNPPSAEWSILNIAVLTLAVIGGTGLIIGGIINHKAEILRRKPLDHSALPHTPTPSSVQPAHSQSPPPVIAVAPAVADPVPTAPTAPTAPPPAVLSISPASIYNNLESRGFAVTKTHLSTQSEYRCHLVNGPITYTVEIFAPPDQVDRVATLKANLVYSGTGSIAELSTYAATFYQHLGGLILPAADQPTFNSWVTENLNTNHSTTLSGLTIQLTSTARACLLRIATAP